MVFASSAMKAAQRERSERKSPDLYRRAELKYWAAKRHYMVKDYEKARNAADEAKRFAEQAEIKAALEALKEGY